MRADQERVKKLLTEAVTLLCRNSLQFEEEVTIEGLIGVTLDRKDIFLVSIQETIETGIKSASKRSVEENEEPDHYHSSPNSSKRQKHLHISNNNTDNSLPHIVQPKIEPIESDSHFFHKTTEDESVKIKIEKGESNNISDIQPSFPNLHHTSDKSEQNSLGQNHDRLEIHKVQKSSSALDNIDSSEVEIKKEKLDEDPCFVIDSDDDEDYGDSYDDSFSNMDRSSLMSDLQNSNWQSGDTKLDYVGTDADFMNSSQFQNRSQENWSQSFDMSQMPSSSNDPSFNMLMENSYASNSSQNNSGDPNQRSCRGFSAATKIVQCTVCSKTMLYKNLHRHINAVHLKIQRFNCPYCHLKSSRIYNIKNHILSKHSHLLNLMENDNLVQNGD